MEFPNLRGMMKHTHTRIYDLAQFLKMSDASFSQRLTGRYQWAPHERNRLSEYFGINQEWLFAPLSVPPSARRERAMRPFSGIETR